MDQELIDMADMYAGVCTRQEEKFQFWRGEGCPWRWEDCEAAFDLLIETTTGIQRWEIMQRSTRRGNKILNHFELLHAYQRMWH